MRKLACCARRTQILKNLQVLLKRVSVGKEHHPYSLGKNEADKLRIEESVHPYSTGDGQCWDRDW